MSVFKENVLLQMKIMLVISSVGPFVLAAYTETNWQTAVQVSDYKSYASSSTLYFTVPSLSTTSIWQFNAYKSPNSDKCDVRSIMLFLQPGSFPVINPLNETFPEDFNTLRTELKSFQLLSDNHTYTFIVNNPVPGGWYLMAYLSDYVDDSIKQKGIHTNCKYYMGTVHVTKAFETVSSIPVDTTIDVTASNRNYKVYRYYNSLPHRFDNDFQTTEQTWQFQVEARECSINESKNLNPCPIRLSTRALALPMFNSSSNVIDCSDYNSSQCIMTVTSPATLNEHYLIFESTSNDLVHFKLIVSFMSCTNNDDVNQKQRTIVIQEHTAIYNTSIKNVSSQNPEYIHLNNNSMFSSENFEEQVYSPNTPNLRQIDSLTIEEDRHSHVVYSRLKSYNNESVTSCNRLSELGRFEIPTKIFDVEFKLRYNLVVPVSGAIDISEDKPLILSFEILQSIDTGGTLKYAFQLETKYLNDSKQVVKIHSCIQRLGIPMSQDGVTCLEENYLQVNSSDMLYRQLYFPYPEPGLWYITMIAECFNANDLTNPEKCRQIAVAARVKAELKPCVDSSCGEYGSCMTYYSAHHRYSSCKCKAGYQGYGCTDDSVAESDSLQLASTLLLTLSNLMFLPAIVVAIYRKFYPEALSYTYTMFFSAFYHACDSDSKYVYCLMTYNVLSYCDFFGAIMSVWITFVALSRLNERPRSFLFVLAGLFLAMGVTWDRYSVWTFTIPALAGALIMSLSWTQKCYRRKECYPSKKRWLFFMVPGILIAGIGFIVYAFFETESNYWYTHSSWHACMALCIVFVLPPRKIHRKVNFNSELEDDIPVTVITQTYPNKPLSATTMTENFEFSNDVSLSNGNVDAI